MVQRIAYESAEMVVTLREAHDVSQLNLIAPDGSLFAQTPVATGATSARIQILDIKPGIGGYEHYEPGRYELVAIQESGSQSITLELRPNVQIVDIRQYLEGEKAVDLGNLVITVENIGTAPTWIYDITYREAPNTAVNRPLVEGAGVPQITVPKSAENLILAPHQKRRYVGSTSPLLLANQKRQNCNESVSMDVIVGVAAGAPLQERIVVMFGGEAHSAGLLGEYVCSDISVVVTENSNLESSKQRKRGAL
ncbi:hypothetical protein [Haloplanus aerogenes]|uniref:hypothetical protein n=1 Tax=Haloplanus aerogenes TaxID=660522 RepID=UPI0011C438CF|nr:hypothetical protein [Haloplanus aerogenes]